MRIMAIDYGDARTGIAVSDAMGILAGGAWTVHEPNTLKVADIVKSEAELRGVERLVVGYPRNMDGSAGVRAEKCAAFGELLRERTGLEVVMWDERLTTVAADKTMMEAGIRREHRKEYVDMIAATFILQGYLDYLANQAARNTDC